MLSLGICNRLSTLDSSGRSWFLRVSRFRPSKQQVVSNPIDVHRATDAVLVQLDALAESHKKLLFIATSNFPQAVDAAFTSRCDLVLEVPLPTKDACRQILTECLEGLGAIFTGIEMLPREPGFSKVVDEIVGLDGRAIRKAVANAFRYFNAHGMHTGPTKWRAEPLALNF